MESLNFAQRISCLQIPAEASVTIRLHSAFRHFRSTRMAEPPFKYITVEGYSVSDENFTIISEDLEHMRPDQIFLLFKSIEAIKRYRKGIRVPFMISSLYRLPEEYYKLKHPLIEVLLLYKCSPNVPEEMYFYRMLNADKKEDSDEIPTKRRKTSDNSEDWGMQHLIK